MNLIMIELMASILKELEERVSYLESDEEGRDNGKSCRDMLDRLDSIIATEGNGTRT